MAGRLIAMLLLRKWNNKEGDFPLFVLKEEKNSMGFLEDLGKKVADAGQKTKAMSDIVRLETLVSKEESKLKQVYGRIGKMYAELHADNFEEEFSGMFDEIRAAEQNIQNYREQIDGIKNSRNSDEAGDGVSRKCPNCGADVLNDTRFCTSCGKPIPRLEASSDTEEKKYCTTCGTQLAPDGAFCENCGTKVS